MKYRNEPGAGFGKCVLVSDISEKLKTTGDALTQPSLGGSR